MDPVARLQGLCERADALCSRMDAFEESKHPRASDGKFGRGSGGAKKQGGGAKRVTKAQQIQTAPAAKPPQKSFAGRMLRRAGSTAGGAAMGGIKGAAKGAWTGAINPSTSLLGLAPGFNKSVYHDPDDPVFRALGEGANIYSSLSSHGATNAIGAVGGALRQGIPGAIRGAREGWQRAKARGDAKPPKKKAAKKPASSQSRALVPAKPREHIHIPPRGQFSPPARVPEPEWKKVPLRGDPEAAKRVVHKHVGKAQKERRVQEGRARQKLIERSTEVRPHVRKLDPYEIIPQKKALALRAAVKAASEAKPTPPASSRLREATLGAINALKARFKGKPKAPPKRKDPQLAAVQEVIKALQPIRDQIRAQRMEQRQARSQLQGIKEVIHNGMIVKPGAMYEMGGSKIFEVEKIRKVGKELAAHGYIHEGGAGGRDKVTRDVVVPLSALKRPFALKTGKHGIF